MRGFDAGAAAATVALLQEIGLNKYARIFLKQEVDLESLLQFGDQDLKDIGVVAIGARRKLTAAIHRSKLKKMASPVDDAYNSEYSRPSETDKLRMPFFRGRYRLTGKTYLGGSAIVKIATDEKTSATVAIKLHAKTRTFVKELKFLRQLRSEYVVPLIDHFEDEQPCLVLKAGEISLAEHLKQGQLKSTERKHVLERLVSVLEYLHSKQLVCVDLKPQNLG